ncbi:MAG: molybdopterin-dependent oxidoreductase [Vicinamibacterales bacterium]
MEPNRRVSGHEQVIETACPLDCPDSCSLSVTVNHGRVVRLEGSWRQPATAGVICAKVRRFPERLYGDNRLLFPALRSGPKGSGQFTRTSWDEALNTITSAIGVVVQRWGGEAILPFSYGGSNGLLSQDTTDARLFRRLGASRLDRTVCAAPTGRALSALYGRMPSVTYEDYAHAKLIVVWGANPSTSAIHLLPYINEARSKGGSLVVIDPRTTPLARTADLHMPVRTGTDVAVALAVHRHLFSTGAADDDFLREHTRGADALRERAEPWTIERAAAVAGIDTEDLRRFADMYASLAPAVIRCGWGLERNRNGGNAALAVLALPAVAGKFGVRGGGYTLSNSSAWKLEPTWIGEEEPPTRAINMNHLGRELQERADPPIKLLFVYNCNPLVTMPDQNRVLKGLQREDLFTVVFDQVMTDTAHFADVVLPATTFLEAYDIARAYGPLSLQLVKPVVEPAGEARSNADVFGEIAERLHLVKDGEPQGELDMLMRILGSLPEATSSALEQQGLAKPPFGTAPVQFVDVFPGTPDGRVNLFPLDLEEQSAEGIYRYRDEAPSPFPLTLISPASERTISSTLGELPRPEVRLLMHPDDAAARGIEEGALVAVVNDLGEVRCTATVAPAVRPGTVVLPKGLWRRNTRNGSTANALVADRLADFAGGATFNDARVEVKVVSS